LKEILVATDLSARSDRAIERAILLAAQFDAHLEMFHVVDEELPASVADAQRTAAEADLHIYAQSVQNARQIRITINVGFGKDWSEILRQSETRHADLIVLGLHREREFDRLFLGTTVERVVRGSDLPVLVVRNRALSAYGKIVVGMDFSVYSRKAVEYALTVAPEAEIYLVHAHDVPFRGFLTSPQSKGQIKKQQEKKLTQMIEDEMAGFFADLDLDKFKIFKVLCEGEPRQVLREQIKKIKPELFVLGTHGRTGVARALLGSVAEDFLTDPPCDVLAVKAW